MQAAFFLSEPLFQRSVPPLSTWLRGQTYHPSSCSKQVPDRAVSEKRCICRMFLSESRVPRSLRFRTCIYSPSLGDSMLYTTQSSRNATFVGNPGLTLPPSVLDLTSTEYYPSHSLIQSKSQTTPFVEKRCVCRNPESSTLSPLELALNPPPPSRLQ